MKRRFGHAPKTERINMCLTQADRESLEAIAKREDRDLGYLATWFLQWGIEQYTTLGATLVELRATRVVREKEVKKHARERLVLREEVQRTYDALSGSSPEKKRA